MQQRAEILKPLISSSGIAYGMRSLQVQRDQHYVVIFLVHSEKVFIADKTSITRLSGNPKV